MPKLEIDYRIRNSNDEYRWMLCRALAIREDNGTPYRFAGSQTDITKRKEAAEQWVHDALHDSLTGLANPNLLPERLAHLIRLAQRRQDYRFAVAIVDLDRFKTISDSFSFDSLKIDRALVHQMDVDDKNREIVRAIVTLADNLGLTVIAEGCETPAEVECLRTVGCEFTQAMLFPRRCPTRMSRHWCANSSAQTYRWFRTENRPASSTGILTAPAEGLGHGVVEHILQADF